MKKIIVFLSMAVSLRASAQIKTFCLAPNCPQTITTSDSAQILAQLTTSDGAKGITWVQTGGQQLKIPVASTVQNTALQVTSSFWLKGVPAGTYVFTALGVSTSGVTGSVTDTLTVIPTPRRIAYIVTVFSDSTRITTQ